MPLNLAITLFTFPSKITPGNSNARESIAPAVEGPIPGNSTKFLKS